MPVKATSESLIRLAGKRLPTFNDWQGSVVDDKGRYLYIFGGCAPKEMFPTSHFFRLDLQGEPMAWVDLTWKTRRLGHYRPSREPIPARSGAGVTFYQCNDKPYLLIYGGIDATGIPRADLISVDLTDLTWVLQTSDVLPRVEPALALRGDYLCIFGGYCSTLPGKGMAEKSYSVLHFDSQALQWEWQLQDATVPEYIGPIGSRLGAVPWILGVLVVRGKLDGQEDDIELSAKAFHNYNPITDCWSRLSPRGDLPPDSVWFELRSRSPEATSAHMCVWYESVKKDEQGNEYIVCDVWSYEPGAVHDKLTKLDVDGPIWRQKTVDLELFHHLPDGRMLMFGAQKQTAEGEKQRWVDRKSVV